MVEKINLKEKVNAVDALFTYLRIGKLNDQMLIVLQAESRTLDFHVHEKSDELFYCMRANSISNSPMALRICAKAILSSSSGAQDTVRYAHPWSNVC